MEAHEILDHLDDDQRAVAEAVGCPVGVIAGAGTGKTRTLTHRLAYQAGVGELEPRATMALTFTTAAATEIDQRLQAMGVRGVAARTFHSACLRQAQYFWPQVYHSGLPHVEDNRESLISRACATVGIPARRGTIHGLDQEISWTKQTNVLPEDYPALAAQAGRGILGLSTTQVAEAIVAYEEHKQADCVIDLDDLLLCTVALLSTSTQAAREVRRTYRWFLFDEFQDLSPVQYRLVELWVSGRPDVLVVGDPAQTIHSFAGARSVYLEEFSSTHSGAVGLSLRRNYRSTPQILSLANAVSASPLPLLPMRDLAGEEVVVAASEDRLDESQMIADWLKRCHKDGVAWEDMAILYRTHRQAEAIRQILADEQVPFAYHGAGESQPRPGVHLGTLHGSKGREWEVVCLAGMDATSIPHPRARTRQEQAEESRLVYVGITRARSRLMITWPRVIDGYQTSLTPLLAPYL